MEVEGVVLCLKSKRRLEREKGLSQLKNLLNASSISPDELQKLQETLLSSFSSTTWEEIHGAAMAAILLVPVSGEEWTARVRRELPQLLQHKETRIGTAAGEHTSPSLHSYLLSLSGELLGHLCRHQGVSVYCELKACLMGGIHDNLERDFTSADPDLMEKLSRSRHSSEGEEEQEERVNMNSCEHTAMCLPPCLA